MKWKCIWRIIIPVSQYGNIVTQLFKLRILTFQTSIHYYNFLSQNALKGNKLFAKEQLLSYLFRVTSLNPIVICMRSETVATSPHKTDHFLLIFLLSSLSFSRSRVQFCSFPWLTVKEILSHQSQIHIEGWPRSVSFARVFGEIIVFWTEGRTDVERVIAAYL
jgi:uncharacterized membrane protein